MNSKGRQIAFAFDAGGNAPDPAHDGLSSWREQREKELHELGRRIGQPLGYPVEVWLKGGIRLKGILRLAKSELVLPEPQPNDILLAVDGVPFRIAEVESCVRAD